MSVGDSEAERADASVQGSGTPLLFWLSLLLFSLVVIAGLLVSTTAIVIISNIKSSRVPAWGRTQRHSYFHRSLAVLPRSGPPHPPRTAPPPPAPFPSRPPSAVAGDSTGAAGENRHSDGSRGNTPPGGQNGGETGKISARVYAGGVKAKGRRAEGPNPRMVLISLAIPASP